MVTLKIINDHGKKVFNKKSLATGLVIVFSPVLASGNELEHSFKRSKNLKLDISLAERSLRDWLNSDKISNLEFSPTCP
jgi:hypothetical protein